MAVEESGAEAAPTDDAPPGPEGKSEDAQPELEELKRRFREALERKRGAHASAEGAHETGKLHGSHGPAVSRRSFRRKSGG